MVIVYVLVIARPYRRSATVKLVAKVAFLLHRLL